MAQNTDIPETDELSAEEMAIWNQDEDPSFEEIRAALGDDEPEQEEEILEPEAPMEQPEDELSTEDSDIDAEEDETEITPTEDVTDDNQPEADEKPAESKTDEVQRYKVKANGMEFEFSNEELIALAPKAMDYTKKMQEIAPYRKSISALKEAGLSQDDLNLAIDVLKGDKGAFAEVAKRTGIELDTLEMETEETNYVPNQYGKDEHQLAIEDVVNQISIDPEYQITQQVVDSTWDGDSRKFLAEQPQMILGLHNDIKNGVYDKVAPIAFKKKALDGGTKSDLEYYVEAGKEYFANQPASNEPDLTAQANEVNRTIEKNNNVANQSKSRKAASITKSNSGKRDVIDYLDDNDEAFDEWYKNLKANQ